MNREQVLNLPGNDNPVLCMDGKLGILAVYPGQPSETRCGVQVHGEHEHRWIEAADLTASEGGALRQTGSPKVPSPIAQQDMTQLLLAIDWERRGGSLMAG